MERNRESQRQSGTALLAQISGRLIVDIAMLNVRQRRIGRALIRKGLLRPGDWEVSMYAFRHETRRLYQGIRLLEELELEPVPGDEG